MLNLVHNPLQNITLMDAGLDKIMNDFFKNPVFEKNNFTAPLDILEKKDSFVITAEFAGVEEADLNINVEDGELTIEAEKQFVHNEDVEAYHRMERSYGTVRRALRLPETVNYDAIEANFNNGLLILVLPKQAEAVKKRIDVKIG